MLTDNENWSWTIIYNVDWDMQTAEWRKAAKAYGDHIHAPSKVVGWTCACMEKNAADAPYCVGCDSIKPSAPGCAKLEMPK